ncbi:MAG: hypothetical protein IPI07_12555 [Flavobacteriales bacterium]|nr:hypothetical protein [Flavobacteriales bacterium]
MLYTPFASNVGQHTGVARGVQQLGTARIEACDADAVVLFEGYVHGLLSGEDLLRAQDSDREEECECDQ